MSSKENPSNGEIPEGWEVDSDGQPYDPMNTAEYVRTRLASFQSYLMKYFHYIGEENREALREMIDTAATPKDIHRIRCFTKGEVLRDIQSNAQGRREQP